jgi:hypothetical protein
MTTFTCPDGHTSAAGDYCDVCGAPITAVAAGGTPPPAAMVSSLSLDPQAPTADAEKECPNCHAANVTAALFCEDCGYDFTTGQLPADLQHSGPAATAPVAPADWVAEVWVDPDWYAHETSTVGSEPCPPAGVPRVVALHAASILIGRTSDSRGIHPDVDCGSDSGVSRRHVHLSRDGDHWYAEDLQSTNGTFVSATGAPLPDPAGVLAPGQKVLLGPDDRLYLGAWTRIVVRAATDAERNA